MNSLTEEKAMQRYIPKIIIILLFLTLIFSFYHNLFAQNHGVTQDCSDEQTPIATITSDLVYHENWLCTCNPYIEMSLNIIYDPSFPNKIKCGHDVILNIVGGCAPFILEIASGQGYTLTKLDERQYIVSCSGDVCGEDEGEYSGVVKVNIEDSCRKNIKASIKNYNGRWIYEGHCYSAFAECMRTIMECDAAGWCETTECDGSGYFFEDGTEQWSTGTSSYCGLSEKMIIEYPIDPYIEQSCGDSHYWTCTNIEPPAFCLNNLFCDGIVNCGEVGGSVCVTNMITKNIWGCQD